MEIQGFKTKKLWVNPSLFLSINGEFFPILRQSSDLVSQNISAAPASQIITILDLRKIRSFMDQKPQ